MSKTLRTIVGEILDKDFFQGATEDLLVEAFEKHLKEMLNKYGEWRNINHDYQDVDQFLEEYKESIDG